MTMKTEKMTRILAMSCLLAFASKAEGGAHDYLKKPEAWFAGDAAREVAANILSWQSDGGGWPKNVNVTEAPFPGNRQKLRPTFDNGATTDELRFLARIYNGTKAVPYRTAFYRGMDYVLAAQYPSGGWPQFHPPGKQYHRHITFNDDAMVRVMTFLKETYQEDRYAFLDARRRTAAHEAFNRGVACILKCQVLVEGQRTAWCAQHDELDYSPRPGRSYELVSLSGSESVGIVRLLMGIEDPDPEVVQAIEGAAAWFKKAELRGMRVEYVDGNEVVVDDPSAAALWARFYELGTNRPMFCDRDGVVKYRLDEIGHERRNGYRWLGTWPRHLLERDYPNWEAERAGAGGRADGRTKDERPKD